MLFGNIIPLQFSIPPISKDVQHLFRCLTHCFLEHSQEAERNSSEVSITSHISESFENGEPHDIILKESIFESLANIECSLLFICGDEVFEVLFEGLQKGLLLLDLGVDDAVVLVH